MANVEPGWLLHPMLYLLHGCLESALNSLLWTPLCFIVLLFQVDIGQDRKDAVQSVQSIPSLVITCDLSLFVSLFLCLSMKESIINPRHSHTASS